METLLKFPSEGKRRQIVRRVRHDHEFSPQLYFLMTEERGRLLLWLEQTVWDTKTNQTTSRLFFKHTVVAPSDTLHCAIDEKDKWLYIVYGRGKRMQMERHSLKYEKPDKLGYRPATVLAVGFTKTLLFKKHYAGELSAVAVNIYPSAAIILHCKMPDGDNNPGGYLNCRHDNQKSLGQRPINMLVLGQLSSLEMEARSHVLSRSNDWLTLISYHTHAKEFRNRTRVVTADGYMILESLNTHMQSINSLKIDPVRLVQNFLPKAVLDGLKANAPRRMPDFVFFGAHLQLLGEVHKYVLFFFHHNYLLAAKWPKNWYKLQQVPKVQRCRTMSVDLQKKLGDIRDVWLMSTDLYFKFELQGAEMISRRTLGHMFKDYRNCAFCHKQEKRKRKNNQGKRMSSFKVCRLCKKLNLHKCYNTVADACHYCSLECMRKHWKQHKLVHNSANK